MNLMLLKVKSFRNIKDAAIRFSEEINIITGLNSAGKTNLVEAAGLILTGCSIRKARSAEMIGFNYNEAYVDGIFKNGGVNHKSETYIGHNGKQVFLDGKFVKSIMELTKKSKCLFFSNLELLFFTGTPEIRRHFVAEWIIQYEPSYIELSRKYRRILKERNAVLQKGYKNSEKIVWDEELIKAGVEIIQYKEKFLKILNTELNDVIPKIFDIKGSFSLRYKPNVADKEAFIKKIEEAEKMEKYYKTTITGPHRDDFIPEINGRDTRRFGSEGERKSFLIGVKLSLYRLIEERYNVKPVFIMDDFDSRMDIKRREGLLHFFAAEGGQFFLTTPLDTINQISFRDKNYINMVNGAAYTEGCI